MFEYRFALTYAVEELKCKLEAPCMSMRKAIIRRVLSTFNGDGEIWIRSRRINCRKPTGTGSPNRARASQSTDTSAIFTNMSIPAPSLGRFFSLCFFYDPRRNIKNIEELLPLVSLVNKRTALFCLKKRAVVRIRYISLVSASEEIIQLTG